MDKTMTIQEKILAELQLVEITDEVVSQKFYAASVFEDIIKHVACSYPICGDTDRVYTVPLFRYIKAVAERGERQPYSFHNTKAAICYVIEVLLMMYEKTERERIAIGDKAIAELRRLFPLYNAFIIPPIQGENHEPLR